MKRRILLALVAALALAVGVNTAATAAAGTSADAQATAKKKAGKKKAAKCKTAKKKAKGKAKARKSLAAADSAAKKNGKAKGKKAKKKCAKAKAKPKPKSGPKRRFERKRLPHEQEIVDRYRERREELERRRESRPPVPTVQDMAPADGTYTSPSVPGLTVTVSGNSTQARITYTLPKTAFSGAPCQTKDVPVDVSGEIVKSSTGKGYVSLINSAPNGDSSGATGYLGKDGSFTLSVQASYQEPPGSGAYCSGFVNGLTGVLVK